mmetsp:Transcript_6363/g.10049  ORF Transcript_6363/g.10049 Transcript_6363/m.10049 type:complete len:112 (+) Transcript_6363:310-645(+)
MLAAQKPGDALWPSHWIPAEGENTIAKRSQSSSSTLLYCSWFCPFAQRAWIAMEEKDIDYKYVEVNPYEVDPKEEGGIPSNESAGSTKTTERNLLCKFLCGIRLHQKAAPY